MENYAIVNRSTTSDTVIDMNSLSLSSIVCSNIITRQNYEIKLRTLFDQAEESWTPSLRQLLENVNEEDTTLEKLSKKFKCKPFIIERLVNMFYVPTNNNETNAQLDIATIRKIICIFNGENDVRILVLFKIICRNDAIFMTNMDLQHFFQNYFQHSLFLDQRRVRQLVEIILKIFHLNTTDRIGFEEFHSIVSKNPDFLKCIPHVLAGGSKDNPKGNSKESTMQQILSQAYSNHNHSRIIMLTLYVLINLSLLIYVIIYRAIVTKANVLLVLARACGMLLNFNCSFIIILMLKQTILLIRSNRLLRILIPVDDHIDFHRFVGRIIMILSILHTVAHLMNTSIVEKNSLSTYLFTIKGARGLIPGFAYLAGFILLLILSTMVICSLKWVRSSGHFQFFYWSHLLYIPFYVFLILHTPNFWKWIVGPLGIFLIEKIYSVYTRYTSAIGRTHIHSVVIEQSNVVSLTIDRPKKFRFRSGDYVYINLPSVAVYEFHPFTISSAPEEKEFIRVHIQSVGDWTKNVYEHYKRISEEAARVNRIPFRRSDIQLEMTAVHSRNEEYDEPEDLTMGSQNKFDKRETIIIKGPYSSCARYVFDCKHAILIAGGIGVTPYASILSSLLKKYYGRRFIRKGHKEIYCISNSFDGNRQLQKVDFIWVNRDVRNFGWFINLLRQFEDEQENYLRLNPTEKRFLDLHLYCTGTEPDEYNDYISLNLLKKIWPRTADSDVLTNLRSKTEIGRPHWEKLFNKFISYEYAATADDVNVFFCGPAMMGKTIKQECEAFRFRYYDEKF